MLSTESDQFTEFILGNRRGSRVVRITENKEIVTIFERLAEIINIQEKIPFFLKMIIFLCASGERKFTLNPLIPDILVTMILCSK